MSCILHVYLKTRPGRPARGPSGHLVGQVKLTLSERQQTRANFYTLLPECIRALCRITAWIVDSSPLQAACVAPLRPKGAPLAPLYGYPLTLSIAFSLLVMRSMEPHRQVCSIGREAVSPGLGGTPTRRIGKSKRISRCLACLRYRKFLIT